jgi:AraC-like DNA-binding protein
MAESTARSAVMSFGYSGPARGPGYEQWIEDLCRRIFEFDYVPDDGFLDAQITAAVLPEITLATCTASPTRIETAKSAGGRDDLVFPLAPTARCVFDAATGPVELKHQSGWLCERRGSGLHLFDRGRIHTLHVSRAALRAKVPFANDLLHRRLDTDPAAIRLLTGYYETLLDSLRDGLDDQGRALAAAHLVDLVALCIAPSHLAPEADSLGGVRAARIGAILREITSRAATADLSAARVGAMIGVSERYVRQLLQDTGRTFSENVLEQRLLLAHKLLTSPHGARQKIAEIALAVGFNDISHFNRAFRRRFGDIPSAIRAATKAS